MSQWQFPKEGSLRRRLIKLESYCNKPEWKQDCSTYLACAYLSKSWAFIDFESWLSWLYSGCSNRQFFSILFSFSVKRSMGPLVVCFVHWLRSGWMFLCLVQMSVGQVAKEHLRDPATILAIPGLSDLFRLHATLRPGESLLVQPVKWDSLGLMFLSAVESLLP